MEFEEGSSDGEDRNNTLGTHASTTQAISLDITPEEEASKFQFLRRQFFTAAPVLSRRDVHLGGRTAIVTWANGGIGLECSRQLLDLGLTKLILAVRDEAKGEAARQTLTARGALEPSQTVEAWKLDHAFLRTNYLSTALLVLLLLRVFERARSTARQPETSPGRIVVESSDTAAWAKFGEKNQAPLLQAFDDEAKWDTFDRYATTKLLGQLFGTELSELVPPSLAIVNCAHPGLCYGSGLARELGLAVAVFIRIVGRSAALGARTLVHAAINSDGSSHGQYVEDGKLRP
ncbi:hypothetical protein VPNG_01974 [Cytospora leucostoma]|uniref:Ketoreductase (KR) domain-containing protein n=1 Tax=Cytospora leucostoma TaxID=1230097 RepID=A0A423XIY0_9PEZI|nr:hypothetical protein VPNG_01974 [Cytospora leucostoma]